VLVDLAAWCRRESVKGGRKDALNGVWERRQKQCQRPPFSGRLPTDTQLLVDNILITSLLLRGLYTNDGCCAFSEKDYCSDMMLLNTTLERGRRWGSLKVDEEQENKP
jgi:hypothetical protein